jgi:hypothetical protein
MMAMNRRDFFGWIGKIAAAIGLSQLAFDTDPPEAAIAPRRGPSDSIPAGPRMNGRACSDYRMISADQSILLDKDIFNS